MNNSRIPKKVGTGWKIPWKKTSGKITEMGRQHQEGLLVAA